MRKIFLLVAVFTSALVSYAEIKMASIFDNNMMFQQDKKIIIWGRGTPKAEVSAEFDGKKSKTKVTARGNWVIHFPAQKGSFDAKTLKIFENGKHAKTFKNILVGEVWIAGGQSNMARPVKGTLAEKQAIANATKLNGKIRYFSQPIRQESRVQNFDFPKESKWVIINGQNVEKMSGVGYYFAERLLEELNVPVGIIFAAQGASRMCTWTSKEELLKDGPNQAYYKDFFEKLKTWDADYPKAVEAHKEKMKKLAEAEKLAKAGKGEMPKVAWYEKVKPSRLSPEPHFNAPSLNYNAKVFPLRNFITRGVIWYQGEADSIDILVPYFSDNFKRVVDTWRKRMVNPELPFLQVQLASYEIDRDWARARQAQFENTKRLKNVYMASVIDYGEQNDIHPRDKLLVGDRLVKLALEKIYRKKGAVGSGAEVAWVDFFGNSAVVKFNTFGGGLVGKGNPRGFEVLVDGKWQQASAQLKGDKVVVLADADIKGVRYLWKNWAQPDVWLFSKNGIPAIPFYEVKKFKEQ